MIFFMQLLKHSPGFFFSRNPGKKISFDNDFIGSQIVMDLPIFLTYISVCMHPGHTDHLEDLITEHVVS